MPMLGTDPWSADGKTYIRKSLAVPQGMQAFWTSRDGGMALGVDHISNLHPELIEQGCDTIVLNPMDYEAVKKSMQEAPARERRRDMRKRSFRELQGFDPNKIMRESMAQQAERARKDRDV